jgi:hypothetical protein
MNTNLITAGDVLAIIADWRSHYPEDVFPGSGQSYECKAAKLARHICDNIASDVIRAARPNAEGAILCPLCHQPCEGGGFGPLVLCRNPSCRIQSFFGAPEKSRR